MGVSQAVVTKTEDYGSMNRSNVLDKDDRTAILKDWKQEHDERTKAREDHFRNFKAPQGDVIKIQADLLKEANRKLDLKLKQEEDMQKGASQQEIQERKKLHNCDRQDKQNDKEEKL